MDRLLRPTTIDKLRRVRAAGQRSVIDLFSDTWVLWERERPPGWQAGQVGERWHQVLSGKGTLQANGAGGPQPGEHLIVPESPYRLRVAAQGWDGFQPAGRSAVDLARCWMVLNGTRLFTVDVVKLDDADDLLATAFLAEIFGRDLPVEGMP